MSDERLALVAEVVDKFSGPLANLRKQLGDVKASPHMAAMRKDFVEVEGSVAKSAATIRNQLSPALAAMGVSSLGAVVGISAIGSAVSGLVTSSADVRRFSNEVGVSIDKFRELNAVGQRFGIDTSQMQDALRGAQQTADDFRKKGQTYTDIMARFPTLGKALTESTNMDEFAKNAIDEILKIPNAVQRADAMMLVFKKNLFAGVSTDELKKATDEVLKHIATLPKGAAEAAEAMRQRFHGIREQLEALRDQGLIPIMKPLNDFITGLGNIGSANVDNPKLQEMIASTKDFLEKTNWKEVGSEFGESVLQAIQAVKNELAEAQRILEAVRSGVAAFKEWQESTRVKDIDARGPDRFTGRVPESRTETDELQRRRNTPGDGLWMREQLKNLVPNLPSLPSMGGNRADAIQEQMSRLNADKRTMEALDTPRARARLDENTAKLKELTEELRRLRESGGATVQQQSLDGASPFGGARIQTAGFGGGGLGFRRPGGFAGTYPAPDGGGGLGSSGRPQLPNIGRESDGLSPPLPPGGRPSVPGIGARPQMPGGPSARPSSEQGRANRDSWLSYAQRPLDEGGLGLTREQAQGMVAGMMGESGKNLDPGAYNPSDRGLPSGGTMQWRDDRLRALREFAAKRGDAANRGMGGVETQQQFQRHEFLTDPTERKAFEALKRAGSSYQALDAFVRKSERPQYAGPEVEKRSAFLRGMGDGQSIARPMFPPAPRTRAELAERAGTADVSWPWGWAEGGARAGVAKGDRTMGAPPSADWFPNAMKETGSSPQKVEGDASLKVRFENMPQGTKVDHSMDGMFRSISIDKGRSMQAPQDV